MFEAPVVTVITLVVIAPVRSSSSRSGRIEIPAIPMKHVELIIGGQL
jgi:hypothetical protein